MNRFSYENTETKVYGGMYGGKRIVRKVSIKNGKGYKSVSVKRAGRKAKTVKRRICREEIKHIQKGVFIPGLFDNCKQTTKYSRK
jgi:hypothetical protein